MKTILALIFALLSPSIVSAQQTYSSYVNSLPPSATLTGPEYVYILQNGVSKKTTVSALRAAIPVPPVTTPCNALQLDFTDITGCDAVAVLLLVR